MSVDISIQRVREFRRSQGWALNRLATAAGLRESTIRKLDADDWNPTAETLRALEQVVDAAETGGAAA